MTQETVHAAVLRKRELLVDKMNAPRPDTGQIRVRAIACGVCGSDLHFAQQPHRAVELLERARIPAFSGLSAQRDIHLGHEFVAEVLELGPDTNGPAPGTVVTSFPALSTAAGPRAIGYSNEFPGGYAEQFLVSTALVLPVPVSLDPKVAALTEPLAVARHAVTRALPSRNDFVMVVGCGMMGIALIVELRRLGIETIVAFEPSPFRREVAAAMGATTTLDASTETLSDVCSEMRSDNPPVVFEAVGTSGIMRSIINAAPRGAQIVVVGASIDSDTFDPLIASCKEITVRFSFSSTPEEFADTLGSLADGEINPGPIALSTVTLDELPAAFAKPPPPDDHLKLMLDHG